MTDDSQTIPIILSSANDNRHDDFVQTFQLEESNLRGRIVRVGPVLDAILTPHQYPSLVADMVAEVVTLALLLSSMLKYEGVFTLQAQGDGAVTLLVADVTSEGDVRACASFDADKVATITAEKPSVQDLMGQGYLAFTIDQGDSAERYQGIVDLKGDSFVDCAHHYFAQSEQILTSIRMATGRSDSHMRASAIMLQHMPEEGPQGATAYNSRKTADDWERSQILLETCRGDELLDTSLLSTDLLYRLFHEEGVRVYPPETVRKGCRCSQERIEGILKMMGADDLEHMTVDRLIRMTCEFCSKTFTYDPDDLAAAPLKDKPGTAKKGKKAPPADNPDGN